jgi:ankyrin repeat protein
MCKILVEAGSDITILDSNHKTAAHYAKKYNKN